MPNEQNLIPLDKRTKSEQRKIQSMGGCSSGVSRRRKKSLREATDLYLSMPVANRKRWNAIAKEGVDPEDIDNQMAMIIGLTQAAMNGDSKAAKVIIDLLPESGGKAQADQVEDDPITKSLKEEAQNGL